ncbi:MAG: RseA family anti-sigma factor [Pseudomonas sp.]
MSREALQESLSAVMDNEADELELRRVLAASDDNELRATWSRYQIARAVMHKELLEPRLDIAAAVSAALAEETVPAKPASGAWRTIGRIAVAASVTVAVLAGVRFYNQDEIGGAQLAQQGAQPGLTLPQMQTQGPAVLAGYNPDEGVMQPSSVPAPSANWQEQRLPSYLRQHAQQAAASSADSALPYARAASLENR